MHQGTCHNAAWRLSHNETDDLTELRALLAAFPRCSSFQIEFPQVHTTSCAYSTYPSSNAFMSIIMQEGSMNLQPAAHSHQALATLLAEVAKLGSRDSALLSSVTIKGPPISQFQFNPAMEIESPLLEIAGASASSVNIGPADSDGHQGSSCLISLSIVGSMANSLYPNAEV